MRHGIRRFLPLLALAWFLLCGAGCAAGTLDIDTEHIYRDMESSWAEGYVPTVQGDTVCLVVPFLSEEALMGGRLKAELSFGEGAPFVYANYRKTVEKKKYKYNTAYELYVYRCSLRLSEDAKAGKYPVTVTAEGTLADGQPVTLSVKLYVTVSAKKGGSAGISNLWNEDITADLIEEETLEAETAAPSPADTPDPGTADGGGSSGYMDYGGGDGGGTASQTEKVYRQPKITLTSQSLAGQSLAAGQTAVLSAVFANRSATETVYNLKVTAAAADESLTLSKTSWYIDSVPPGGSITTELAVTASPTAQAGMRAVSFSFSYEDVKGNGYSDAETLTVEISQKAEVTIENLEIADTVYALETVTAGVQLVNTGRSAAYNVQASLSGDGLSPKGTVAAGTIEAGGSYEGSIKVYVSSAESYGEITGTLTLTWEDVNGETFEKTQEFTTVVAEPKIVEIEVPKTEAKTNQWWAAILVAMGLLFLTVVAGMGLALRRMKNRMADLEAVRREMERQRAAQKGS